MAFDNTRFLCPVTSREVDESTPGESGMSTPTRYIRTAVMTFRALCKTDGLGTWPSFTAPHLVLAAREASSRASHPRQAITQAVRMQ